MKWFRRKDDDQQRRAREAHPAAGRPDLRPARPKDWRSYDAVAETVARVTAPHTALVYEDVLAIAEPAGPILDVGTGNGLAIEKVPDAFGVDISEPMLRAGPRARVAAADVLDLPFAEGTFDVVTVNFALPTFTRLDTALFDIVRVARPGGRVAVSVWGAGEDDLSRTWRMQVEQTATVELVRQAVKDTTPWADKLSDAKRLETALRDARLRPVRVERRRYKFQMSREDYIAAAEAEPLGRFVRSMLSDKLWDAFRERVRAAFEGSFEEQLGDFRDVLIAVGTKPA